MTTISPQKTDNLEECLKSLLVHYDINIDLKGLIGALPIGSRDLQEDDLGLLSEKLELAIEQVQVNFGSLEKFINPVILPLEGNMYGVFFPDPNERGQSRFIVYSGDDPQNITVNDIREAYKGYVISIYPKGKRSTIDISHMQHGHAIDWFWKPIKSFRNQYAEVVICSFFINFLALSLPIFTMNVYDRVIVNFVQETLIVLTSGVILALIFDFLFKFLRANILEKIASKVATQYDTVLMERFLNIKDTDMDLSVGEKANIFRELHSIKDFYASRLIPTLVDIPFFFLFALIIYLISPPLAIIPFLSATLIIILNFSAHFSVSKTTEKYFTSMQNKSTVLVEMLGGLSTIRSLNANGFRLFKWKSAAEESSESARGNSFATAFVANFSNFITQVSYILVIFFGVYEIRDDALTVGGLIACSIIFNRCMAPIVGFSTFLSRLKQSEDVLLTIDKIFQIPHESMSLTQKGLKENISGRIEIRDLSYQYPSQARSALYKVNLDIAVGDHVGLIGRSGAGKSTLSAIIASMITPSEGRIFMDSFVYDSIPVTELRRNLGYVQQEPYFFKGSIRENILMGYQDASAQALENAIHISGLDLVMQQTGEGLDMDVGEGGRRLSGGQRQAISLARTIVRDPKVIIFDEPTNGMDNALEERVKTSLQTYLQKRTFVLVTHRTSLLSLVNRLVLLDRGIVAADGSREEILKKLSGV